MRKQLVEVGRRLYERGLLAGADGNLSVRLDDGTILMTPSGRAKGFLTEDNLVLIDSAGRRLLGELEPSSEKLMHLAVYRRRPDVGACVHTHAPYATAFAVAGQPLSCDILPEMILQTGQVPLTEYAPPGTEAVPAAIEPYLDTCQAFLLRNHGLLTLGRTLDEAWSRHEVVELNARIAHLARQLGGVQPVPAEDIERLEDLRRRTQDTQVG